MGRGPTGGVKRTTYDFICVCRTALEQVLKLDPLKRAKGRCILLRRLSRKRHSIQRILSRKNSGLVCHVKYASKKGCVLGLLLIAQLRRYQHRRTPKHMNPYQNIGNGTFGKSNFTCLLLLSYFVFRPRDTATRHVSYVSAGLDRTNSNGNTRRRGFHRRHTADVAELPNNSCPCERALCSIQQSHQAFAAHKPNYTQHVGAVTGVNVQIAPVLRTSRFGRGFGSSTK